MEADGITAVNIYPVNGTNQFGLYEEGKCGAMLSYEKDRNGLTFKATATDRQLLLRIHDDSGITEIPVPDASAGVEIAIAY